MSISESPAGCIMEKGIITHRIGLEYMPKIVIMKRK